jgi:hypothetical protein
MRSVLCQTTIPGLNVAELALQHMKRMLNPGPDFGNQAIDLLLIRVQCAALGCLTHDTPELAWPGKGVCAFGTYLGLVHCLTGRSMPEKGPRPMSRRRVENHRKLGCRAPWPYPSQGCAQRHCRHPRRYVPSCRNTNHCPLLCCSSRGRACRPYSWSRTAHR